MSTITPASGGLPATEGPANNFEGVRAKLASLQAAADALQEHAELLRARMDLNANAARQLMDLCAAAGVVASHTGRIADISAMFARVAGRAGQVVTDTDAMGTAAGHVVTQHRAEYGGIHTASTSSPVPQGKPGFYRVV
ncbi:hypothetical protein ACFV2Q_27730 [Streptomyces sp. NPDC059650]|uniref:hypothetical protein n=1 Tax=Streptomyces sp. NPDC059650 TaxID=3346896 RepID=UPI0036BF63D4